MKIQTVLPDKSEPNTENKQLNMSNTGYALKRNAWFQFVLFVGCYVLFDYAYFKIPVDLFENVIYYHGVVAVCADFLNLFAPLEQIVAQKNHLLSAKADLEIVRGCDGAGVLFLLLSAIVVFQANRMSKLVGMAIALVLIYSINILRICLLYFVITHHAEWFLVIHTYIAPTFMVIVGCGYFACWALGTSKSQHEFA